MNLIKLLQSQGFGSRREAEYQIRQGLVSIDGTTIDDVNFFYNFEKKIKLRVGEITTEPCKHVYLMLNKPANYETSHKPQFYPSVFSLLPDHLIRRGVQAVGRLDADTTGLLLLTDDGQFIHRMASGKKQIEKIYEITTSADFNQKLIDTLLEGVHLHDEPAAIRASSAIQLGPKQLRMGITTGKYHQVKRMIVAAGNHVDKLHRVQVGDFHLPLNLKLGQWNLLSLNPEISAG
jgi:16S rRNA pseudouridine516 synthase